YKKKKERPKPKPYKSPEKTVLSSLNRFNPTTPTSSLVAAKNTYNHPNYFTSSCIPCIFCSSILSAIFNPTTPRIKIIIKNIFPPLIVSLKINTSINVVPYVPTPAKTAKTVTVGSCSQAFVKK